MRARRSLGVLEAFVAVFLAAAEARAGGTWSSVPNPPGFSGQIGALHGGTTTLFLGSGFSKLWTSPLASPFQFTPLPGTGLGYPMAIDRLFSNASDEPLLVLGNILSGLQSSLWYYDTAAAAWKQAAPTSLFFAKPPRVCRTKGGHLLASTADSIYASTDGGRSWALRTTMTTWISAPPPLPASGAAVGDPSYGTNLIYTAYPGYTLAFDVMPWGEIFLGNETLQAWHSYDEGFTWEHVDPLWLEPQRDMTGVPQYVNPHLTTFGRDSNTAGSGETKDAEVLLNGDQNDQQNFYRLTTTGQIVPLDVSHVVLPHTDPTTMAVTLVNLGQSKSFTTLRSGETLSAPTPWDHSNANINPDGRNAAEITRWDGSQLDLASPPSGTWAPFFSDSSFTATDGTLFYALSTATSNNVMAYTPDPQSNQRPAVNLVASPVTVTMSAATGLASLSPASSFSVSDDGLPSGTLSYRWSARGHGPVTFDDPFGPAPTAYFRMPGHYVLTLIVDDGARTSGNAVLVHVLPAAGGSAPAITAQPSNQLLTPGAPATFTVAATGSGLVYQWIRNGVELADGPTYSGTSSAQLTIASASNSDIDSTYFCRIGNAFGRVVSNAGTLGAPPVVTTPPQNQTVPSGTPATLSVAASGAHPMRWQWYAGTGPSRTKIASNGNQSAYTTSTPGTYEVDVTNAFGTVTSAPAQVATGAGSTFVLQVFGGGGTSQSGGGPYAGAGGASAPIAIATDRFAVPALGARFTNWTTSSPLVAIANPLEPQTSVVVTGATAGQMVSVLPHYAATPAFALTVVNGTGSGVTRVSTFAPGSMVRIAAHPAPPGLVFDHWVGAPIDGSTATPVSLVMPAADTRLTAVYAPTSASCSPDATSPTVVGPAAVVVTQTICN